jgi:DNA-directed RNA polymerase subunit H
MAETDITKHVLVPEHSKLPDKDPLAQIYNAKDLPRIMITDPAIRHLKPKEGDIIKIVRKSKTAGESIFLRRVVGRV